MDYIDALLNFDFDELLALLDQVINNPLANVQASLLFLIAVVVLTLVAIALVVLFIGFGDEDEDEGEGTAPVAAPVAAPAVKEKKAPLPPPPPLTPEERRWRWAMGAVVVFVGVALAWVLAGVTTSADTMCLSCHGSNMPHAERLVDESVVDPHKTEQCVSCHEPGGKVGSWTYNVPGRTTHYALAMALPERAVGYGAPIRASACLSCHESDIDGVVEVEERGVKVSHKEPIEAGATCVDCHEMQQLTGAVGAWTVGMSSCLRCHDNKKASAECDYCHTKDIAYAMHADRDPKPSRLVPDPNCGSCHEMQTCNACHGIEMPHSAQFLQVEHPRRATLETWNGNGTRSCDKCHTAERNPCTKCHKDNFPGHPPSWRTLHGIRPGAGLDGACDGCHGDVARLQNRNFCAVCHDEYPAFKPE